MFWRIAIAVVLVNIGALMYVYQKARENRNRNHSYQERAFHEEQSETSQRNILCTFCNKCIRGNNRRLPCGHLYHESCYLNQSARRRICSYCRNSDNEAIALSSQRDQRFSILNECCYCQLPLEYAEINFQLACQHSAHRECYDQFNHFMQCQVCNAMNY